MGEVTGIGWTDKTWNPFQGCTKVSAGCKFCYMYREKERYGQDPSVVVRSKPPTFNAPLKWKEPARVFTCSWSDFFHEAADEWRAEAWDIIRRTKHLTYQILTKRIERAEKCLPPDWLENFDHVWLGTTVEEQAVLNSRAFTLRNIPARVRFLSLEPLLGDVNLDEPHCCQGCGITSEEISTDGEVPWCMQCDSEACYSCLLDPCADHDQGGINWVIVGCESGPNRRKCDLKSVKSIVEQCAQEHVSCFVKQLEINGKVTANPADWPEWARVQQFPEIGE